MTKLLNISTLCRCCHSDGSFKSLNQACRTSDGVEIYNSLLYKTLGITILRPQGNASYTICEDCIRKLQDAFHFKNQVLACEHRFQVYFKNEEFFNVATQNIKTEIESGDTENEDLIDYDDTSIRGICANDIVMTVKEELEVDFDRKSIEEENVDVEIDLKLSDKKVSTKVEAAISDSEESNFETPGELLVPLHQSQAKHLLSKPGGQLKHRAFKIKADSKLKRRLTDDVIYELLKSSIIEEEINEVVTYSCKTCESGSQSYRTRKGILKHLRLQHRGRFECGYCDKYYRCLYFLKRHVEDCHGGELNRCRHCKKTFRRKWTLELHERTHANPTVYECHICQKKLLYKHNLTKHITETHSEYKLLCDYCGWSFNQKGSLESHIKSVHLKLRPFPCKLCGRMFTSKKHMKNHMKTHFERPRPYKCDYCSKQFIYEKSYDIHRLTHDGVFTCKYCAAIYNNKKEYRIHVKNQCQKGKIIHSAYTCPTCNKVLMTKYTLNRHLRLHNGVRRFSCAICNKKFNENCDLQKHIKRRHDPNNIVQKVRCLECKQSVRNIDKHMELHKGGRKRFACNMCEKSYAENNLLNRHKKQKHFGFTHDCVACDKKFIKKKSWINHNIRVHKLKVDSIDSRKVETKPPGVETT